VNLVNQGHQDQWVNQVRWDHKVLRVSKVVQAIQVGKDLMDNLVGVLVLQGVQVQLVLLDHLKDHLAEQGLQE